MNHDLIQAAVFEALDNCRDNGYDDLLYSTPTKIAQDIITHDADLDHLSYETILYDVERWFLDRGTLRYYYDGQRHLVCRPYSITLLHRMARDLGIKSRWYHKGRTPHYDIPVKAQELVAERATLIPSRDVLRIIRGQPIEIPEPSDDTVI